MDYPKQYTQKFTEAVNKFDLDKIKPVVEIIRNAKKNGKTIFIMGNGGSASTASHFACDLGKNTIKQFYEPGKARYRVVSLNDNIPMMTAYSNDLSYDEIFSQQLHNLIHEGDIVIAITGSGNSKNVVNAVKVAKKFNATTIGMLGFSGGKLLDMVDYPLHFEDDHYGRVEDFHMMLCHIITNWIIELEKE